MKASSPHKTSVPWTPRDIWYGSGAFALWLLAAMGFVFLANNYSWEINIGVFITLWELILLLPAWWFTVRKYDTGWNALGLRGFRVSTVAIGCGFMLLSFGFNFAYNFVLSLFNLQAQPDVVALFDQASSPWPLLVGGVVVAPVVEELFFRGFVFTGLREKHGWKLAGVISAGLFAVLHLQPWAVPPIFLLGLIFAYLYHRSESIWPAVIMHVITNGLGLGAAYLVSQFEWLAG
jgi:hypothetical protein